MRCANCMIPIFGRERARIAAMPVLLVLLPLLVKLPLIAGLMCANPMLLFSGMQQGMEPGLLGGFPPLPTIDPNIAFTSHALGHRAALDMLAGHIPWWNPFEGVGAPLAGEMQSAALFPLTWLLAFSNGQLYEHIAFQIIAGLSAYFLLRQLDLRRPPAFAGAAVFAFNGVFAWLANAVINPVPFLPMLLLGIERAAAYAHGRRAGGGTWVTIGIATSLYAGFPEVAYLNGLLAAVWTITRTFDLPRPDRWMFLAKVVIAGIAGLLIAAPILIAFADYLPIADVGGHTDTGFFYAHLDPGYLTLVALPYLYGGIFFASEHNDFWQNVGGYGGCALLVMAFAGVFGRRLRVLRWVLAAWVVVAFGLTFGASWLHWMLYVIPGLRQTALYRYLPASWIMCLCVLAALALDDLKAKARGRAIALGLVLMTGLLGAALFVPQATTPPFLANDVSRWTAVVAAGWLVLLAVVLTLRRVSIDRCVASMVAILVGEALVWFALPTLYNPRHGSIELEGVGFLRAHLGLQRFATLGPIAPNYGAYFGIAEINQNDLPIPRAWGVYLRDHLDHNALPIVFNGVNRADPNGPSAADALLANRAAYAAIGVRYVVTMPDQSLPDMREVFRGRTERIYEIDDAAPYFAAPGCRLDVHDRTHLVASCASPSTLVRLEMAMPGWRALVAGTPADITKTDEIFQAVTLPAGDSAVSFDFEPPFMRYGYAAFAAGLLILTAGLWRRAVAELSRDFSMAMLRPPLWRRPAAAPRSGPSRLDHDTAGSSGTAPCAGK
jgi:hypothetical protein